MPTHSQSKQAAHVISTHTTSHIPIHTMNKDMKYIEQITLQLLAKNDRNEFHEGRTLMKEVRM